MLNFVLSIVFFSISFFFLRMKGLVGKNSVVPCRGESETRKFGIKKKVEKDQIVSVKRGSIRKARRQQRHKSMV